MSASRCSALREGGARLHPAVKPRNEAGSWNNKMIVQDGSCNHLFSKTILKQKNKWIKEI
jgi:hypothetical protein